MSGGVERRGGEVAGWQGGASCAVGGWRDHGARRWGER